MNSVNSIRYYNMLELYFLVSSIILALTKNDTTSCELFNSLDACESELGCDESSGQPVCK